MHTSRIYYEAYNFSEEDCCNRDAGGTIQLHNKRRSEPSQSGMLDSNVLVNSVYKTIQQHHTFARYGYSQNSIEFLSFNYDAN